MREKIDLGSDISVLLAQLRRLAASRIGRQLGLGPLLFVEPKLAQALMDLDAAVEVWGDDEVKEEWKMLKRRVIRKAALTGIRKLSEQSILFIASSGEERGERWASSGEDEELA